MNKINILVIDDNIDQLEWFRLLNSASSPFHFHTLQNELNAAEALEKTKPQVILLDMSLNTLDGPIIATILNGHNFDDSKLISMSANPKYKMSIDEKNFLLKPLTKDSVINKIQEVLKLS